MMSKSIFRKTTKNLIGIGGEPEGDNYTFKTEILIIDNEHLEDFQEVMAEEYGNQDYSHMIKYDKLCGLTDEEFENLKEVIKAQEGLKVD